MEHEQMLCRQWFARYATIRYLKTQQNSSVLLFYEAGGLGRNRF